MYFLILLYIKIIMTLCILVLSYFEKLHIVQSKESRKLSICRMQRYL